jgi:hypothetical protein
VQEQRHLVVRVLPARAADHDPTEQAPVDVGHHLMAVVVERPGANGLLGRVEDVGPALLGTDLVGAAAVGGGQPERPGAVGVDAAPQPVQVEAVGRVVVVEHTDEQPLARLGVQHCPGTRLEAHGSVMSASTSLAGFRVV